MPPFSSDVSSSSLFPLPSELPPRFFVFSSMALGFFGAGEKPLNPLVAYAENALVVVLLTPPTVCNFRDAGELLLPNAGPGDPGRTYGEDVDPNIGRTWSWDGVKGVRTPLDQGDGEGDGGAVVLVEEDPNTLGPLTDAKGDVVEENARNPPPEDVGSGSSVGFLSGGGEGRFVSLGFASSSASSLGLFVDSGPDDFLGDMDGLTFAYAMKPTYEKSGNRFSRI